MKNLKSKTEPQKLFCQLASTIDEDRIYQLSSSEQFEEMQKNIEAQYVSISSLKEARKICSKFIDYYNLGGSNWTGGRIVNENHEFVAFISYNGKIWDNEDTFKAKEIII